MEDQYYDIERRTAIKEEARMFRRKFITYEQAEVIYSISHRKLRDIAEKAGAVYRINDVSVLINKQMLVYDSYSSAVKVFETTKPISVRTAETSLEGSSIYKYDPKGKAADAYRVITKVVLNG